MPFFTRHFRYMALGASLAFAGAAVGQTPGAITPAFDPHGMGAGMAGQPTQVMVLGTDHLSQMPVSYRTAYLAPLLDRLADFHPQIITIESLSGPDCEYLTRYKAIVPGLAEDYCWGTDEARVATGLDVPRATVAVEQTLRTWPSQPTAAARRHLAALFLAANDRSSAVVQWLRLPEAERRAGDGLDATLVDLVTKVARSPNENIAIAATLAARLGLERVYPVDDHSADSITATLGSGYEEALRNLWAASPPIREAYETKKKAVHDSETLLDLYRFLNSAAVEQAMIASDMGQALKQQTPELYGRRYVAWWQTRNLRMVANIVAVSGHAPGARVLAVVGSTHKPYFEKYLSMMSDFEPIDTAGLF